MISERKKIFIVFSLILTLMFTNSFFTNKNISASQDSNGLFEDRNASNITNQIISGNTESLLITYPQESNSKVPEDIWTIMVYLDGDNNLEEAAIDDFEELELGYVADAYINVIVLIDRHYQYDASNEDWTGARYYQIQPNESPIIDSILLADLGEVDMGDPLILQNFIEYCFINFPAQNYLLDIWDHGAGVYGCCSDETSGTILRINELQSGINTACSNRGERINIVSFDCCLMNMIELSYELRTYCDYLVASEESIPFNGYNYKGILDELFLNVSLTPLELGKIIVDIYHETYSNTVSTCLSLIDLSEVSTLIPSINYFVGNLTQLIDELNYDYIFSLARCSSRAFYDTQFIDIIDFCDNLLYYIQLEDTTNATMNLKTKIEGIIAYNWQHSSFSGSAHGLSIFMPVTTYNLPEDALYHYANRTSYFAGMDWQNDCLWGEFLRFYYDFYNLLIPNSPPMLALETESQTITLEQNQHTEYIFRASTKTAYEISIEILTGDIDFDLAVSYSQGIIFIANSELVNPTDGQTETIRLILALNIYYIFIRGIASSSTFKILIHKDAFTEAELNNPIETSGGSPGGNGFNHYIQDLHHYYSIALEQPQTYQIVLNNSLDTAYQIIGYDDAWEILFENGPLDPGASIVIDLNVTVATILYLEVFTNTGFGNFTIEIIGETNSSSISIGIIIASISTTLMILTIIKKRKNYQ
ncbi:MAG: hypothetical protein FK734_18675 [Asgard group archaeon]|nr:hypothetical protein [Asgard group archaeon]